MKSEEPSPGHVRNLSHTQSRGHHKMKVLAQSTVNLGGPLKKDTSTNRNLISTAREKISNAFGFKQAETEGLHKVRNNTDIEEDKEVKINQLVVDAHYGDFQVVLKISSKMETRTVNVPQSLDMSVKDFKEKFFLAEAMQGIGVRLINSGKEMRDSHKLSDHNLKTTNTVYVFFFKREDLIRKETSLSDKGDGELDFNNITDTEELDFDYYKERQNLTDEEVVWKRFCFHAPFIFRADMPAISDPILFKREYDFMKDLGDTRHDADAFRKIKFDHFSKDELKDQRNHIFFIFVLVGIVIGLPVVCLLPLRMAASMKTALSLGLLLRLCIDSALTLLFEQTVLGILLGLLF